MGSFPTERRFKADSVAVIGAGPSGLAAAKYLLAEGAFSEIQIFEQRANVGGIWNYVPCPDSAPKDLAIPQTNPHLGLDAPIWNHSNAADVLDEKARDVASFLSPLYDRLETNIPRGLMGFSDLEWPSDSQLFPKHATVQKYIEDYAEDVRHLIKFHTQVMDIRRSNANTWVLKTQPVTRDHHGEIQEHTFDAVVAASGHFNIPYIPKVAGIEAWSKAYHGAVTHSKYYRKPEHFSGKKVIVVGNSASGIDIASQIRTNCRKPLISSCKSASYLQTEAPPDQLEKPPISRFITEDRTVVFADGSRETGVDAVLYCTGYFYSFPFLTTLDPPLTTTGERTENLYRHMFYRPHPTLAFPVLNQKVIPFPMAEVQGAVIARVFSGRLTLPSESDMKQWEDEVIAKKGAGREFHVLKFPEDADYIDMMHDWAMSADGEGCSTTQRGGYVRQRSVNDGPDSKLQAVPIGKEPPYWGEKEYWTREQFPAIKKAFQSFGEGRHQKFSLNDVGFNFDEWKKQKAEEGKRLL